MRRTMPLQLVILLMNIQSQKTGYIYFLIDAERSIYEGIEQYLKLGDYYRFAFYYQGNDYAVILLKLK